MQAGKFVLAGDTTLEHDDTTIRTSVAGLGPCTDISVRLVKLPSLEGITREYMGGRDHPQEYSDGKV